VDAHWLMISHGTDLTPRPCSKCQIRTTACPYTGTVTGNVTLIPAASLVAGDTKDLTVDQCTE
jgi:hypothetical protein